MSRAPLIAATVACVTALAFAGCGGAADSGPAAATVTEAGPTATPSPTRTPGYPSSLAVLGHSGSTGEDSDPAQPHVEIRTNSWATRNEPAREQRLPADPREEPGDPGAQRQPGARVPRCRYDDGAFARQVHRRAYVSEDLNHFLAAGHAKAAAVAWTALRHAGLIP